MYRNNEHYSDPTFGAAYASVRKIERRAERGENYVPWVYIASPYRGDVEKNITAAKKYSLFAVNKGRVPMTPHIYFTQFLNDGNENERRKGMNLALQMLKRCKEIWVFGSMISSGMKNEIRAAQRWNIPIRYFSEDCREVEAV